MYKFGAQIKAQGIEGRDLPRIDAPDLFSMGVVNFRDRKDSAQYFAVLRNNEGNTTDSQWCDIIQK